MLNSIKLDIRVFSMTQKADDLSPAILNIKL